MPNQSHSGLHGIPWHRCDRCGIEHPVSMLRRQRGLILCVDHACIDKPLIWERNAIIQEVLQNVATGSAQSGEPGIADILIETEDVLPEESS